MAPSAPRKPSYDSTDGNKNVFYGGLVNLSTGGGPSAPLHTSAMAAPMKMPAVAPGENKSFMGSEDFSLKDLMGGLK